MLFATNELNPLDSWHLTPYKHLRLHALLRYFVYQLFQICFSPHLKLTLKTAVIKPLLKKNNLDASILNNYRPISNLPFVVSTNGLLNVKCILMTFSKASMLITALKQLSCQHNHQLRYCLCRRHSKIDMASVNIHPWPENKLYSLVRRFGQKRLLNE